MRDPEYILRREEWFKNRPSSLYNPFDEGEEISVYDPNIVLYNTMLDGEEFPECLKEAAKHFGEKSKIEGRLQTLVGVAYSYMDCYYIFQDDKFHTTFVSCVGKINFENNLEE